MSSIRPVSTFGSGRRREKRPIDSRRHLPEVVVLLLATGDTDQLEALGQGALVGEVVERRQQLAVREVTGGAEDDERGRADGQPLEPLDQRVILIDLGGDGCALHRLAPFEDLGYPVGEGWDGLRAVAFELGHR